MFKFFIRLAVLAGVFIAGLTVGRHALASPNGGVDQSDLPRTLAYIKALYVDDTVTDEALFYGSIKGIVATLGDPYSEFTTPKESAVVKASLNGKFAGIGITIEAKEGRTVVVATIPDAPAANAGLKIGDIIVSVDGESVDGKPVLDAVDKIRGDADTKVTVTIYRKGEERTRDITIIRKEVITDPPVTWEVVHKAGKRLMVLKFPVFNKRAEDQFAEAAIAALSTTINGVSRSVDGIVLDLRNNPGGYVPVAQTVACAWIKNSPMLRIEPRKGAPQIYRCVKTAPLSEIPTVVLVNGYSASASEIVAGALQDMGKARIIGEKTFGKGSGQNLFDYPDGSMLRLTTFLWKTPKGRTIHKAGIMPDEVLEADPKDLEAGKDVQLDRALQYLSTGR